jgi:hypothetical protein
MAGECWRLKALSDYHTHSIIVNDLSKLNLDMHRKLYI